MTFRKLQTWHMLDSEITKCNLCALLSRLSHKFKTMSAKLPLFLSITLSNNKYPVGSNYCESYIFLPLKYILHIRTLSLDIDNGLKFFFRIKTFFVFQDRKLKLSESV